MWCAEAFARVRVQCLHRVQCGSDTFALPSALYQREAQPQSVVGVPQV